MNLPSSPSTLLFLPRSASKNSPLHSVFPEPGRALLTAVAHSAEALREGRQGLADCVDWQSPEYAALDYYDGALYQVPGLRGAVAAAMRSGAIDVVILSGGYGAVYADEPIHWYEKQMDFAYWKRHGLPAVLEECVELSGARTAYGFVARTTAYARILRAMDWPRLRRRSPLAEAGLFYLDFPPGGNGLSRRCLRRSVGRLWSSSKPGLTGRGTLRRITRATASRTKSSEPDPCESSNSHGSDRGGLFV